VNVLLLNLNFSVSRLSNASFTSVSVSFRLPDALGVFRPASVVLAAAAVVVAAVVVAAADAADAAADVAAAAAAAAAAAVAVAADVVPDGGSAAAAAAMAAAANDDDDEADDEDDDVDDDVPALSRSASDLMAEAGATSGRPGCGAGSSESVLESVITVAFFLFLFLSSLRDYG